MIEHSLGEFLRPLVGKVATEPTGVEASLVHAHKTYRGEVIVECSEVTLGVGVQTLVKQLGDDRALDLERTRRDVHHVVKAMVEVALVLGKVAVTRHIDGNNADRAGALTRAEEAAGLFAQLAQVKTQTAAHGTHVGRLHIAVDIV